MEYKNIDFNAEKAEYKVACSRFSVSVDDWKSGRATSGVWQGKRGRPPSPFHSQILLAADPACRPLASLTESLEQAKYEAVREAMNSASFEGIFSFDLCK